MSVQITIGKNQGITQAIRERIGANKIKNSDLATWQAVVQLVESNPQSQSIFKKDNNNGTQFTTDRTKINDKSSNHSNYVVDQGKVTIDGGIWAKIEKLLTGSKTENVGTKAEIKFNENLDELTKKEDKKAEFNEIEKKRAQAEKKAKFEESLHANPLPNPLESKIDPNKIGTPEVATGKKLTRSVNGKQQTIEIQKDDNGQKVRYAVNANGSRGEELVPVTTTGKNTYQTKSEFDKTVRTTLGLKEGQKLPENLKPFYVEIGGYPQLMFKSDNGTLTPKLAKDYIDNLKNNSQSANTKKEIPDCTNLDAKELKKFIKANDVKKIRFDGKTYTIEGEYLKHQNLYISAEYLINKKATNTKPKIEAHVEKKQEPTAAYTKQGQSQFSIDNDDSSALWGKNRQIFE